MALTPEELRELEELKGEAAKLQNPSLITTREEALARAEAEDRGGLEAGPWYMEFAKELLNPVDMLAAPAKGIKAAGNLGREGLEQTAGRAAKAAAERQAAIDLVKNPAQLEPYARGLVEDAASKMSGRIGTKEDALRQLLRGTTGEINPDMVSEVMPNLGAKMASRRAPQDVIGPLGETITQLPGEAGRVPVTGEQLLRIKRVADKSAKFGQTDVMNPNAAPRIAGAKRVGDIARQQIYDIAPGSQEILGEMGRDIKLKSFLTKRAAKNPVSTLQAKPGTMKESVLAQIDEATGTRLKQAGDRLEQGVADLIHPAEFLRPLQAPAELAKVGRRAAIKSGELLGRSASATSKLPGVNAAQDLSSFAATKGIMDPLTNQAAAPHPSQWTQDDEYELQQLKQLLEQNN